jgi:hypothetical protein
MIDDGSPTSDFGIMRFPEIKLDDNPSLYLLNISLIDRGWRGERALLFQMSLDDAEKLMTQLEETIPQLQDKIKLRYGRDE